jgi:hypothetical protein
VSFAPPCPRKSFADCKFVSEGGAKWSEFRPGGGAKLSPGGAKFVSRAISDCGFRIADCVGVGFAQPLRFAALQGAQNYWLWVLRTLGPISNYQRTSTAVARAAPMNGQLLAGRLTAES